jgi:hypothetical protein
MRETKAGGGVGELVLLVAGLLILISVGCSSTKAPHSEHLAAVVIKDKSPAQIEEAILSVFKQQGYIGGRVRQGVFEFEMQGTGMNTLAYGDWSNKKVWVRVKVLLGEQGTGQQSLLECDAYMVNEHGDKRFEEEHKLTWVHRGKYQDLLEQIKKSLAF